jgi:hypothetical protein
MTSTLKLNLSLVSAVCASSTAMATPVLATDDARRILRLTNSGRPCSSIPSAWSPIIATAEVIDLVRFRRQRPLFAHAGGALFTSRTRGFVQHVV